MKYLLSVLGSLCLANLIIAKAVNITIWDSEYESKSSDQVKNQYEILKSGNDILKNRLEIIELQIEKLTYIVKQKSQKLDTNLEKLLLLLETPSESQDTPVGEVKNGIILKKKLDSNIETKEVEDISQSQTESTIMMDINGEANICNAHTDKRLSCSNIVLPTSCADVTSKACWPNKCYIRNSLCGSSPFWVSCNNTIDDGGWTVIQRRLDGSVNFQRGWDDYKLGFGDLNGEFWIGLDKLHGLTNTLEPVELLVELVDFDDVTKYAKYDSFAIGDEESQYKLAVLGSYSGNAGDSLRYHANMKFSTLDRDNDSSAENCAQLRGGPWWHDHCSDSNLNGLYFAAGTKPIAGDRNGVSWYKFHSADYSMKFAQMMIRPRKD